MVSLGDSLVRIKDKSIILFTIWPFTMYHFRKKHIKPCFTVRSTTVPTSICTAVLFINKLIIARPHKHLPLLRADGKADINIKNILVLRAANPIRMKESFEQDEIRNGRSLFFVAVVVIHTDEGTGEGEGFAVGYKERGINDAGRGKCQPCYKQGAPEDAHCCSEDQLQKRLFHCTGLLISHILLMLNLRVWHTPLRRRNR